VDKLDVMVTLSLLVIDLKPLRLEEAKAQFKTLCQRPNQVAASCGCAHPIRDQGGFNFEEIGTLTYLPSVTDFALVEVREVLQSNGASDFSQSLKRAELIPSCK
jgi:hypothetical protein